MYQLWKLFWMISVQDSNRVFGDIGTTHADLMEVKKKITIMALSPTSQNLFMYILPTIML